MLIISQMARNIFHGSRGYFSFNFVARSSRRVHANMLFRVTHSKLAEFLHRVSVGQILNRFTKDVDKIDVTLGPLISNFSMEITLVILDVYFIALTSKQLLLLIPCALFFYVGIAY